MDIRQYLEARRKQVDAALDSFLPAEKGTLAEHVKAMRYSLFAGVIKASGLVTHLQRFTGMTHGQRSVNRRENICA